jgi:hypothetical protein
VLPGQRYVDEEAYLDQLDAGLIHV